MYCHMSFSGEAFARLIRYRIADSFRPLSSPVPFPPNTESWLDGFIVTNLNFIPIQHDRRTEVNELYAGSIKGSEYHYTAGAIAIDVAADVMFASVADVAAAGMSQPPVHKQSIPFGIIRIIVRASVDRHGIPQLQMELDTDRLTALDLPPSVIAVIAAAGVTTFPFDIGEQLKDIFPPGNTKVLNAGITRDGDGAIVLRFEFPGTVYQSALEHALEWEKF